MEGTCARLLTTITVQAAPLRELWAATFLAQIETKTGAITLVSEPRKRARKRRRLDNSDAGVEAERGQQEQVDDAAAMGDDVFVDADHEMFFGGDGFETMSKCIVGSLLTG